MTPDLSDTFVSLALSDRSAAESILSRNPEIRNAGLYPALVWGGPEQVKRAIDRNPALSNTKGGPRNWEPILYVCFSRFAASGSTRRDALAEVARVLLDNGADPNARYFPEQWPDNPLPCLYGAAGLNNNPELAAVLLDAGANPDDSESLYHATEHADLECLKLLLDHGASPRRTNALKHMLDREDAEGLKLLLEAGADPNESNDHFGETPIHWAVKRGRSKRIVQLLLKHGADPDARRIDGRSAFAMAVLYGQPETADMLKKNGANVDMQPLDSYLAACGAAGDEELQRLLTNAPGPAASPFDQRLLPELAGRCRINAVRALLASGIAVDTRGDMGGTALHWACWKGYPDIAQVLLERGASLTIEDLQYHGTPAGWLMHGRRNCGDEPGNYLHTARVLLLHGAKFPPADLPTGDPIMDNLFREFRALP